MSVFMRLLLQLSTYANRRHITMFMTYLYLLTFVVLISSHVKLSRDYVLKDKSLRVYLKRSLSEYNELNTDAKEPVAAKQDEHVDKDTDHEMFANKIQIERERGDPFRDNKQKLVAGENIAKVNNAAAKVQEKVEKKNDNAKIDNAVPKVQEKAHDKVPENVEKKVDIVNVNNAVPKVQQKFEKKVDIINVNNAVPKVQQKVEKKDDIAKIDNVVPKVQVKVQDKVQEKVAKKNEGVNVNAKPVVQVKKPNKNTLDFIKAIDYKSKYPNVEVVKNFEFDTSPDVKEGFFQNITNDGTFLVFSAYLDFIYGQPYIKILAINGNTFLPRFLCEITYTNDNPVITTKGKIWMLPDHHEKMYKTVFLYCPLPDDNIPHHVTIIPIIAPARLHRLPVMYHPKALYNFTVCLSPLFFNFSIEYELVEWFEINKLMGADRFIVYNHTTVGRTDEILKHYEKEGWIEIVQWQPPEYSDLHYVGQVAMMNDCLFRNFRISKYMVNMDIDELIIPRKGKTKWNEMMTSLPPNFCEYSFRSTLMPTESKDVFEGKQRARELNLHFLLRMTRREYIFGKTVRSKYIVNTTCIDTVGIHYCWKYRNGTAETQRYHVAPREALTYHFRNEPVSKKGKEIEEKAVYKYHTQLIENAKARWDKINIERKLLKEKVK